MPIPCVAYMLPTVMPAAPALTPRVRSLRRAAAWFNPVTAITPSQPNQLTRLEQAREIARQSNKPIQFFGLVLDQNDNPIPDVRVTLEIRTAKEVTPGAIYDLFEHHIGKSVLRM